MVPSTYVSGTGFNMLPNLMLTRFLWEKYYYYLQFIDKKLRYREVKQLASVAYNHVLASCEELKSYWIYSLSTMKSS